MLNHVTNIFYVYINIYGLFFEFNYIYNLYLKHVFNIIYNVLNICFSDICKNIIRTYNSTIGFLKFTQNIKI